MKIYAHWDGLVSQIMARQSVPNRQEAERLTLQTHRDIALLASACSKTLASVQFLNSRLANIRGNKAELREQLQKDVQRTMESDHCSYGVAWNRCASKSALFTNSSDLDAVRAAASGGGGLPTITPEILSLFRLPADTSAEEWKAAWTGNENDATAIHYGKIFEALVSLTQSQKGSPVDQAVEPTKERFPILWSAVEQLAALAF